MSMRMNIRFRPCTTEDLQVLCSFSRKLFFEAFRDTCSPEDMDAFLEHTYNADRIRGDLEDPDTAFWFLYLDDAPVGYIKVNEGSAQTDIRDAEAMELERIYVSGEAQGKGLGSYLMDRVIETAGQKGKKYVWLSVWENNFRAIAFYEKHGFRKAGTHSFTIGRDEQTDYIMRRDI